MVLLSASYQRLNTDGVRTLMAITLFQTVTKINWPAVTAMTKILISTNLHALAIALETYVEIINSRGSSFKSFCEADNFIFLNCLPYSADRHTEPVRIKFTENLRKIYSVT